MTKMAQLRLKVTALGKLLSGDPPIPLKEAEIQKAISELQALSRRLKKYYKAPQALAKNDLATAKAHPVSARIVNFITTDEDRKRFFNLAYFKRKFHRLPADKKAVSVALPRKETAVGYLDAILLYHHWKGKSTPEKRLSKFLQEIETDYRKSPAARRVEDTRLVFRKLLSQKTVSQIAAALETAYPSESELKGFAKAANLKIPPARKGKTTPKKTVHQRLAEKIFNDGALVRMELK
jgi:hypothetical protein